MIAKLIIVLTARLYSPIFKRREKIKVIYDNEIQMFYYIINVQRSIYFITFDISKYKHNMN